MKARLCSKVLVAALLVVGCDGCDGAPFLDVECEASAKLVLLVLGFHDTMSNEVEMFCLKFRGDVESSEEVVELVGGRKVDVNVKEVDVFVMLCI